MSRTDALQLALLGSPAVTFELPYPPSVNRIYRTSKAGGVYKTRFAKAWATDAGWAYKAAGGRRLDGRVTMVINLFPPDDGRRRDVDNVLKVLLDAMNGVAWKDDSQVIALGVIRFPAEKAGRAQIKLWAS